MQIFGSFSNDENAFNFEIISDSKENYTNIKTFKFLDKKVFIHIDGKISKLSNEIKELSNNYNSINEKIAFLYSIDFNFESHICGSFNIFLFNYNNYDLKIIRDTRGTRSLFYAIDANSFFFSSNQNHLIKTKKKVTLNRLKLMEFLNWDYVSNKETFFNEIFRLEPHHCLNFKNNILSLKKYSLSNNLFSKTTNKEYKKNFKFFLYNSVTSLANKRKNIGVMMSGGLDSSAIAIALMENNYSHVKTYSANFQHVTSNSNIHETKYQKNISDLTSYQHSSIQMERKSPIIPIKKFTKILDQPIIFPNIYFFEEIINELKNDKIEIILDGNDGDNTVSHGLEVLYSYLTQLRFIKYTKEIYLYSKYNKPSFLRLLFIFSKEAVKKFFNIKISGNKNSLLKDNLKIKKNQKNIISFFSSHKSKLSIDLHFLGNEYRNDLFRYFGIENFSPFYDEELINFCINMPNKKKLYKGRTRKILRDFLSDFLPAEHYNRDKSILTEGLLSNFTNSDLEIIKKEYKNINRELFNLIDINKLNNIFKKLENSIKISEEELIDLQIFVSANTFLNKHKF